MIAAWINAFAWSAIILISGMFILFGLIQWPGLHWDASLFATPVLNVALGKGWLFGGFTQALVNKVSQTYSSHGQIHVLVFGYLLQANTWEKFFFWCGIVNTGTFIVWTFLFRRALRRHGHPGLLRPILFGLMAGVIALGLQGRPEQLTLLLIAIPLVLRELSAPTRVFQLAQYALIGLLFTLSPASGMLYGMGILFWLSLKYENTCNRLMWREFVVAGLIAVAIPPLIVGLFCPFSILEWMKNILFASERALDFSSHLFNFAWNFLKGYSLDAPFWNILVLTAVALNAYVLASKRKLIGLFACAILAFYGYPKLTDYGYVSFFPLIFLFWLSRNESTHLALAKPAGKTFVMHIESGVAALYALVFVRLALLSFLFVQQGPWMADTRQKLKELGVYDLQDSQAVVFGSFRPSFIVFGDGGDRFVTGQAAKMHEAWRDNDLIKYEEKYQRTIEYFIYPQSYRGQPTDAFYVGLQRFERVYNGWTGESLRFLGVKLGGPIPGYQFALYKKIAGSSSISSPELQKSY